MPYQGFDERLTKYNYVMHRRKIDQVVTRSSLEREMLKLGVVKPATNSQHWTQPFEVVLPRRDDLEMDLAKL